MRNCVVSVIAHSPEEAESNFLVGDRVFGAEFANEAERSLEHLKTRDPTLKIFPVHVHVDAS